jgi:hypothetical protein
MTIHLARRTGHRGGKWTWSRIIFRERRSAVADSHARGTWCVRGGKPSPATRTNQPELLLSMSAKASEALNKAVVGTPRPLSACGKHVYGPPPKVGTGVGELVWAVTHAAAGSFR